MRLDFPDARIVAFAGAETRHWGEFRRAVAATADHVRQQGWRRAALINPDGYLFMVGLFGLVAAGAEAVIPASSLISPDIPLLDFSPETGDTVWDGTVDAERAFLAFFTSGSTGAPKPIRRSLGDLIREVAVLEARWGQGLGDAPVHAAVSHQHIFGLTFRLLWPLLVGRPFARFAHDLWEPLLAEMPDGAVLIASPAHLSRLGGLTAKRRLAGLFTAGAPLSRASALEAEALFGRLPDEIYGSTETGAVATRHQQAPDTPWIPFAGNDVAEAEDGHLRLRSPYVGKGDWVDLQDRIERTDDGFRLLGRLDRVAKIAGKRIDLDAVESAVKQTPLVADATVLALGDILAAIVVLTAEGRAELAAAGAFRLSRRLRADLAASQDPAGRPRRWRFVETLPRTALGKVSRADLVALFDPPANPTILAVRQTENQAEIDLEIPVDLRWFEGHFPEAPVLPGVVQLEWALAEGRRRFGLTQPAAREFQVKFKTVIGAGDRLTLRLTHDRAARRLKFAYERDGAACSSGSIVLDTP